MLLGSTKDRLLTLEAYDEALGKPRLEALPEAEQQRVRLYIQTILAARPEATEKMAQLLSLRSNATAAAQAARNATLQVIETEFEMVLDGIDAENETGLLLKLRSDLRRPILPRKLEIEAQ